MSTTFYYDKKGNGRTELTTESLYSFAKYEGTDNKFFVKMSTDGVDVGQMLNPYRPDYIEGDEHRTSKRGGEPRYQFKSVNKEVFDHYIKFLQTGNSAWLHQAERLRNV